MSTIYGPVPSWRFGRSLGIDVILPPKTCTFDCIYCQLGETKIAPGTSSEHNIPTPEMIKNELSEYLKNIDISTLDFITFSGTGEPTLNPYLQDIVKSVRELVQNIPIVILSNASLFFKQDIRRRLLDFDIVVAKMDAGDEDTFRKINRPKSQSITLEKIVDGIKKFKEIYNGDLALEVMLLKTTNNFVSNIYKNQLDALISVIKDINPDIVQLDIPYRPPSQSFVSPPSNNELKTVSDLFSKHFESSKLWIYGTHDMRNKKVVWKSEKNIEGRILALLKRRPCSLQDISTTLGIDINTVKNIINKQLKENLIEKKEFNDITYYFSL
ncbi:MAG: radical SAM protein [Candidatus Helarchaeota archaeon]